LDPRASLNKIPRLGYLNASMEQTDNHPLFMGRRVLQDGKHSTTLSSNEVIPSNGRLRSSHLRNLQPAHIKRGLISKPDLIADPTPNLERYQLNKEQ
jgi:hypothetical protein